MNNKAYIDVDVDNDHGNVHTMNNKAYIDVDIDNDPELLWLILDTLLYMNRWNCVYYL